MIPVADPAAAIAPHLIEIRAAIDRVLASGWFILGAEVTAFEEEFAAACGAAHGIGVASGTDAVALALEGCGVGAGDVVFTVSHTAVATVAAIESTGAAPVLVDIDGDSYTMSPGALEEAIEATPSSAGRPRAIVAVHLYGNPAPTAELDRIAQAHGLDLIEDAAQAHGASLHGRAVGALGRAAAFSFYPTKNLGAVGDGGMVVTSDPGVAERVRQLRQYGWRERYVSDTRGRNSRLDELQAAVLRILLPHLDSWNEHRRTIARRYDEGLATTSVALPGRPADGAVHVYHQYVVRSPRRDQLREHLAGQAIGSAVLYPVPVHRQPAYRELRTGGDLKMTERVCGEILSLPVGPHVSLDAADKVIAGVRTYDEASGTHL